MLPNSEKPFKESPKLINNPFFTSQFPTLKRDTCGSILPYLYLWFSSHHCEKHYQRIYECFRVNEVFHFNKFNSSFLVLLRNKAVRSVITSPTSLIPSISTFLLRLLKLVSITLQISMRTSLFVLRVRIPIDDLL